jgi:hypothetical protein
VQALGGAEVNGGSARAQQARASARDAGARQALERRSGRVSVNGAGGAGASNAGGVGACSRAPRGVIWHGRCRQDVTRAKDARGSDLRRSSAGGCCSRMGTQSLGRRRRRQARKETVASLGHRHKLSTPDEGRWIEREDASLLAREMHEGRRAGRRGGEAKATVIARRARKEQLRSGKVVRARVTRQGFDAQRMTGSGGKPVLIASQ